MRDKRCLERVVCADTSTAARAKKKKNRRITSGPMLSRRSVLYDGIYNKCDRQQDGRRRSPRLVELAGRGEAFQNRSRKTLSPFSHVIWRKTSGEVKPFNRPRVSRATHLPANLLASGLLPCDTPPPFPSEQEQSLPKINLLRCRVMKSREKSLSRERALLPEFADMSAYKFG